MSPPHLREVERDVLRRIAGAPGVFCLLDYDGTLAWLAPTPADAVPLPGVVALLSELTELAGVQVALVSGRPVSDLRRALDVPGVYYIGIHGLEIRLPDGRCEAREDLAAIRSALADLKRELSATAGTRPGILLEDKGVALACHYRLASAADKAAAQAAVAELVTSYQQRGVPIAILRGHEVSEMCPAHVNKGTAVKAVLAQHGCGALPMYIGDDRTDEEVFRLLPPDAITIRVGPASEPTLARYRLDSPEDVRQFLRAVRECRVRTSVGHPRAC